MYVYFCLSNVALTNANAAQTDLGWIIDDTSYRPYLLRSLCSVSIISVYDIGNTVEVEHGKIVT